MPSLHQQIVRLLTEVEQAVFNDLQLPSGTTYHARNVTISIDSKLENGEVAKISIDFERQVMEGERAVPVISSSPVVEATNLGLRLHQVFGPPGFDSSARAEVFLDVLNGLSDEQIKNLLGSTNKNELDPVLKQPRHRIENILKSFSGSEKGLGLLSEIFKVHAPSEVVKQIKAEWKIEEKT